MKTYTFSVSVCLPEELSEWQLENLEAEVRSCAFAEARNFLSERFLEYERWLLERNGHWQRKDRPVKTLATLFGDLKFERYRVWDLLEKRSRYPLDEVLKIGRWQRASACYEGECEEEVVQRSYRQASGALRKRTGSRQSTMAHWRMVQSRAKRLRASQTPVAVDWKKACLPDAPKRGEIDPCQALGIDLDDTYCRSWKKQRLMKDHGVRVAVIYRDKVREGRRRWRLRNKMVLCSGPGERYQDFLNRTTEAAVSYYGLHENTKVVVHGDGDPGIKNYAAHWFVDALYRLDPWHAAKRIREAFGMKAIPKKWMNFIYGKPDALIHAVAKAQTQLAKEDSCYDKISALIAYLKNNREGMLPSKVSPEFKKQHPRLFLRGSGTIERNIASAVNDRFKLPRMSWSQSGLENLLFLRQNYLNRGLKPMFESKPGKPPDLLCLH